MWPHEILDCSVMWTHSCLIFISENCLLIGFSIENVVSSISLKALVHSPDLLCFKLAKNRRNVLKLGETATNKIQNYLSRIKC